MDINLLVLSLGNSRLAVGAFQAGELGSVQRIPNDQQEQWAGAIEQAWAALSGIRSVVAASVNPTLEEALQEIVSRATGQTVQWIGRQLDLPIEVLTANPKQTGVDRILNAATCYEQLQKECVVIDAGTCITVDCCNEEGQFIGGAIAPGAQMMLDALHEKTGALPQVEFGVPDHPIGNSTDEAIQSGVYHGIRGMVKELLEGFATQLGRWPEVIATGGDAEKLFGNWELIHAIAPNLTLYGIALAYAEHHIKHEG